MASGRFSKQGPWFSGKLNNNYADTVIGGAISTAPAGLSANQGFQTLPGDRIILNSVDALFWSNNNVGNLYDGTFRYVSMKNNSTTVPQRAHAAFWDLLALGANNIGSTASDALYQVTSDEAANIGVALFAGVYINNASISANNNTYWWIQESGKVACQFRATLGGTGNIGAGAYLAGLGSANNAVTGVFDVAATGNATTNVAVDTQIVRYVGPNETLPSNNNISLVDLTLSRASFRW